MEWFRMYSEFASDPKVQSMNEAMQRRLMMLLCLRCSNTLVTLHDDEIAFALRIDDSELAETKALFLRKDFIDDSWEIMNWDKRQFVSDSSAARVAKHRAAKKVVAQKPKQEDETACNVTATPQNRTEQIQNRTEKRSLVEQKQLDVPDAVAEVFAYWQNVMQSPKSVLDANRKTVIARALKNYGLDDVCKAIRGCSKSPHNMGQNEQRTKYNSLELILRNAEKIDRFIGLDAGNARAAVESVEEANARAMREFLGDVEDSDIIEMEA